MKRQKVTLERNISSSYEICIGHQILDRIGLIIAKSNSANRYVVITDSNVSALHGESFITVLKDLNLKADLVDFPAGEESKNMETVLQLVSRLIRMGVDRNSELIALGGGVTGDIVSFISSIFMRSLPYFQVPTSLVAQVDSSIGGKTGIDLPEGKNLIGTFYQPRGVFIDLHFLDSLPDREFRNGLAEIVKYGIIDDVDLFDFLEKHTVEIKNRNMEIVKKMIERSCAIKRGIVEIDEKDMGIRRILNFGHTIGHALEAESKYAITHGDAVSVGMIAAVRISNKLNYLLHEDQKRIELLIKDLDLFDHIPEHVSTKGIMSHIRTDKKKDGDRVSFVLLKKTGVPFITGSVKNDLIEETIEELKR
ncbi:MAG TPA: 3-dehydroquinate synthase [Desulfobacteraceae bacterium]|nr:3-dehydroquinate synthase [Desulfobacteraceae bacterium]HPJ68492.1 3-dehydroquinate synthase [Desulfobacteraceae bacterium]HPQ27250.1 3-dehydroquinate synthase [Desulfobacteraceae bacterium]